MKSRGHSSELPDGERDGHADRLEEPAAAAPAFTANGEALSVIVDHDLLKALEIPLDVGPFETVADLLDLPEFLVLEGHLLR